MCSLNVTDLRSAMDYSAGMEPAARFFGGEQEDGGAVKHGKFW